MQLPLLLLLGFTIATGQIYVDDGNPYDDGALAVSDRLISPPISPPIGESPPMHTRVFYPDDDDSTQIDEYGIFYFVTGFGGFAPPNLYLNFSQNVASHGYVVLSSWPLVPDGGIGAINFTAEAHLANLEYLEANLPPRIRNKANFDYIALGCHSAGCGPTYTMAKLEPDRYKAVINLEPVSGAILGGVDFQVPSINLGAELANNSCSVTGRDFETFYDTWTCPKIMFEVADVGHCGFLDQVWWEYCRDWNFCNAEEEDILPSYRALVQGLTAAFMNTYVQGNASMLEYVSEPSAIPMPVLQHKTDLNCDIF